MPEFMVKMVDIDDVLECGRFVENVTFAEYQGISADAVVIVAQQKIPCLCFIIDCEAVGAENIQLFFNGFETCICHSHFFLINKTPSSVYAFPQRPEEDVNYILV